MINDSIVQPTVENRVVCDKKEKWLRIFPVSAQVFFSKKLVIIRDGLTGLPVKDNFLMPWVTLDS